MIKQESKNVFDSQYCTQLATLARGKCTAKNAVGKDATFDEFVFEMLSEAKKFFLPENGFVTDSPECISLNASRLLMPYPVCAFEFIAKDALYDPKSDLIFDTKRIVLCFDPHNLSQELKTKLMMVTGKGYSIIPDHAICTLTAWEDTASPGDWNICSEMGIINLNWVAEQSGITRDDSQKWLVSGVPFMAGSEAEIHNLNADNNNANEQLLGFDMVNVFAVVISVLLLLNSDNVIYKEVKAPKFINQKRLKKGKVPFHSYHILKIALPKIISKRKYHHGGTHASPRMHDRRSHIRRRKTENGIKEILVKSTVVNAGFCGGKVDKAYQFIDGACAKNVAG